MKRIAAILLAVALAAAATGCSKSSTKPSTDPAAAQQEVNAGNAALASGDYAAANAHYKAAIAKDPGNTQAQFGAAVTEVYLLQDDPEIAGLPGQFGVQHPGSPEANTRTARKVALAQRLRSLRTDVAGRYTPSRLGQAFFRTLALAADNPPAISDIQAIVRNKVMPKLQYAEDRLNVIEAASDFVMLLPPEVTGYADTIEIDKTEAYMLDAVLNGVQGWAGLLVAYNFDVENTDFEHVNPESLLAPGTAWATLHPGGALQLAAAKDNFLNVNASFDAGVAYLAAETDPQYNDVIPQDWLQTQDYADLNNGINQLNATLIGPVDVPDVYDANGQPFAMQLNLGRFFVPAIQDLKTMFPALVYTNHEPDIANPITFGGHPTINGIFPDMTDARWQQLTGLTGPVTATKARGAPEPALQRPSAERVAPRPTVRLHTLAARR